MADERKEAIKDKLTAARRALDATLTGLTDEQWAARAYSEGSEWAVIDILRHVADSERGMTGLMMQIKGGGEGVPAEDKRARDLFGFSILYLFTLFAAILAEKAFS